MATSNDAVGDLGPDADENIPVWGAGGPMSTVPNSYLSQSGPSMFREGHTVLRPNLLALDLKGKGAELSASLEEVNVNRDLTQLRAVIFETTPFDTVPGVHNLLQLSSASERTSHLTSSCHNGGRNLHRLGGCTVSIRRQLRIP